MARHKSAYTFIHSLPRVSTEDQYIVACCCHCNSVSVALLEKIAADRLYRCTQTCVVTLYLRASRTKSGTPSSEVLAWQFLHFRLVRSFVNVARRLGDLHQRKVLFYFIYFLYVSRPCLFSPSHSFVLAPHPAELAKRSLFSPQWLDSSSSSSSSAELGQLTLSPVNPPPFKNHPSPFPQHLVALSLSVSLLFSSSFVLQL